MSTFWSFLRKRYLKEPINLRKKLNKLHGSQYPVAQCSLFKFFLKLLDQRCWTFSKGYLNNFSTELSSQIFDCCPRNFLIQEKQNGNVVSTSHWIRPVFYGHLRLPKKGQSIGLVTWHSIHENHNKSIRQWWLFANDKLTTKASIASVGESGMFDSAEYIFLHSYRS